MTGRGLRALPRHRASGLAVAGAVAFVVVATVLVVALNRPTSAPHAAAAAGGAGTAAGSAAPLGAGGQIIGQVPGFPASVAGLDLASVQYQAPEILGRRGGDLMRAMLARLGVEAATVRLTVGVDRARRLTIGVWEIPGATAPEIEDAWRAAAGQGWQLQDLSGRSVLTGPDPTGAGTAYTAADDGRFLYVVTAERPLAAAAFSTLR
jgi:hypothetical protein